eukprot:1511342-Amphidinium_carterae.1
MSIRNRRGDYDIAKRSHEGTTYACAQQTPHLIRACMPHPCTLCAESLAPPGRKLRTNPPLDCKPILPAANMFNLAQNNSSKSRGLHFIFHLRAQTGTRPKTLFCCKHNSMTLG